MIKTAAAIGVNSIFIDPPTPEPVGIYKIIDPSYSGNPVTTGIPGISRLEFECQTGRLTRINSPSKVVYDLMA